MHVQRLISIIFAVCAAWVASAQTVEDSVLIHFRQSKVNLDTAYMDNEATFKHIRHTIREFHKPDSGVVLRHVKVVGGASPEGSVKFNEWLSKERAERIYDYMEQGMMLPDSITSHTLLGRDWRGLRSMVVADPGVPYRDDVLDVLDEIIEKYDRGEKESDGNLDRLKRLHHGVPYLYVYRNIFPYLREASVVLTFGQPFVKPDDAHAHEPVVDDILIDDFTLEEIAIEQPDVDRPFYMALKTNMIADALALPELGVEFYLGKNLTIVGNWMYGWWDRDRTHRYWRAYGGDLALRWWFGEAAHQKPLTGHHLGVYGGVVTYDFEFGGKGHMGGRPGHSLWDRCMHYFGVEYGYSLPIARRFNIDFTLGLGYMGGKSVEYVPNGKCYEWISTKQKHWYGPTKLEVSLVWLIGHGNYNKKFEKGGLR